MLSISRICKMQGCNTVQDRNAAKGYCGKHYMRLYRHGNPAVSLYVREGIRVEHDLYDTHANMRQRCYNPHQPSYKNYGGRGITVCDRWLGLNGFNNFCADMGERPESKTLDRVDNDKGYSPDNCRWATRSQQSINKRLSANNTSGLKGVYWSKQSNKWKVQINRNGRRRYLGGFLNKSDAINARLEAEANDEL